MFYLAQEMFPVPFAQIGNAGFNGPKQRFNTVRDQARRIQQSGAMDDPQDIYHFSGNTKDGPIFLVQKMAIRESQQFTLRNQRTPFGKSFQRFSLFFQFRDEAPGFGRTVLGDKGPDIRDVFLGSSGDFNFKFCGHAGILSGICAWGGFSPR